MGDPLGLTEDDVDDLDGLLRGTVDDEHDRRPAAAQCHHRGAPAEVHAGHGDRVARDGGLQDDELIRQRAEDEGHCTPVNNRGEITIATVGERAEV